MYQTISEEIIEYEIVEKKSKFIANLMYVQNKIEAESKIKEIKKKYYDARHNCFAYRVLAEKNIYEKSSDDGEPSGTAGNPMLNILKKNNLCNVLVVVTRYFGGILLGTGGLVRSYSGVTIGAIEKSSKVIIELGTEFNIQIEYENFQNFEYYCSKNDIKIVSTKYEENIFCNIEMNNITKLKFLEDIKNKNVNLISLNEAGEKYIRNRLL